MTNHEMINAVQMLRRRSLFWAILPSHLPLFLRSIAAQDPHPKWEAKKPYTLGAARRNKVQVIPVQGVLTKDGPASWGSNYDAIAETAEKAGADPEIARVIMDVDSPGGEVTGLTETAKVLAQVAKVKPIHAVVSGMAASAAYWLTSQASDVTLTPSGEVGSVGVRMMHADVSRMLDEMGIKVTELYSGEFKTEWSPFQPLSDGAKADMQARLLSTHNDFINAVAEGRGIRATADSRGSRFGEGRMLDAQHALAAGMVDKIEAPRAFYKAILPAQEEKVQGPEYGFPISRTFEPLRARLRLERQRFK